MLHQMPVTPDSAAMGFFSSSSAFSSFSFSLLPPWPSGKDRFVGLMVKVSASRAEDPEFESCLRRDFSGVESYQ